MRFLCIFKIFDLCVQKLWVEILRCKNIKDLGVDEYWDDVNKKVYMNHNVINEMIRKQTKYLKIIKSCKPPTNSLLDVGSGSGFFLNTAQKFSFNPTGIEPSKIAVTISKECYPYSVICGLLCSKDDLPRNFGVISAWDVLEHTQDPKEFAQVCFEHLTNNGLFILETPDEGCFLRKIINGLSKISFQKINLRKNIYYHHHRYYFTSNSIRKLLSDIGFDQIEIYKDHSMFRKTLEKYRIYRDYSNTKMKLYNIFVFILSRTPLFANKLVVICRKDSSKRVS